MSPFSKIAWLVLAALTSLPLTVSGQTGAVHPAFVSPQPGYPVHRQADLSAESPDLRAEMGRREMGHYEVGPPVIGSPPHAARRHNSPQPTPDLSRPSPRDLKRLMRPRHHWFAEWEPSVDGVALSSYDFSLQLPTYPIFGPPPPIITSGYSFTRVDAPAMLDLPSSLHEFSLGLAGMRRINDRWMARVMISGVFASDLENSGSDAWQLRGGGFALYRPNERWTFAFGALATGRDDLPVLPAIGAVWEPTPRLRVNLTMPDPRVSFLLADDGSRQHWGYVGGGISGGTWAYNRANGTGDRASYGEWRLVLGWESRPPQPPGSFRPTGTTFNVEVGYAFDRAFEFESGAPEIAIGDALLIRTAIRF